MKASCFKYVIAYLLCISFFHINGQTTHSIDSLIKQWERSGIPSKHQKDYQEYKLSKAREESHQGIATSINNSVNKPSSVDLCYNSGFELSDFSNWIRITGRTTAQGAVIPIVNYNNTSSSNVSYNTSVFAPERFVINSALPLDSLTGTGYDFYSSNGSNYNLKPLSNNGSNYSARIGNANPNYKASKIDYIFYVTANEPFLIYNYAYVFSDGTHLDGEQAAFSIKLTDSVDNPITLGNLPYMVNVNNALNDSNYVKSNTKSDTYDVYYKKWASDTINLCQYIGRTLKFTYEAIDCIYGAHFCYAYVDVKCNNTYIHPGQTISCRDSLNIGFLAPSGYMNYQWTDAHGAMLSAAQSGNQAYLSFDKYLQNCTTGNCSVNDGDVFTLNMISALGCVLTTTYSVKNYSVTISSANTISSCAGGYSGSAVVSPSGGLINNPYAFSWYANNCSGNSISTTNSITDVSAGSYCVHITNGKCIPKDTTIQISSLPNVHILPGQTISCRDSLNMGFLAPPGYISYQWIDANGTVLSSAQSGNQLYLSFDKYLQNCTTGNCNVNDGDVFTLSTTEPLGCISTATYSVKNYSINIISADYVNSCESGHSGSAIVNAAGGLVNNPYNFSWYTNNCSGNSISSLNSISNMPAGNYCVHITNGKCIPKDTIIQISTLPIVVKTDHLQLPACLDSTYTIHAIGNGLNYTWYQNNQLLTGQQSDSLLVNPTHINSFYTLVYADIQACKDSIQFFLEVSEPSDFNVIYCPNDSIALYVSPSSYNPEQYQWYTNGTPVSSINGGTNDSLTTNHHAQVYVIYNINNCKKVASNAIHVFPEQIFLPSETTNVFTPNNDGANDVFYPYERNGLYTAKEIDAETDNYELIVYNRWGTLIHRSIQYSQGWNGKTLDGLSSNDGTYFWIASYISNCSNNSEKTIKKGFVQLIR